MDNWSPEDDKSITTLVVGIKRRQEPVSEEINDPKHKKSCSEVLNKNFHGICDDDSSERSLLSKLKRD